MNQIDEYQGVVIPVYVINIESRTDRLLHIKDQFKGKNEFEINIVKACENKNGTLGLWQSIVKIIEMALKSDDDVIIICEDDHQFTENYSKRELIEAIIKASEKGAKMLIGGVGRFKNAVPINHGLCWIDNFWSTQFLVIYRQFFDDILNEPFDKIDDTADGKFSEMTSSKMVIFPFISVQRDFGYSDISIGVRNTQGLSVDELFKDSESKLRRIYQVRDFYMKFAN